MDGVDEEALAAVEDDIESLEAAIEAAETEADLDDCEETLAGVREALEAIEVPEPEDDEEDVEDPREPLEDRLDDAEGAIDDQRGPYAEDVTDGLSAVQGDVAATRYTDDGAEALAAVAETLATDVGAVLESPDTADGRGDEVLEATIGAAVDLVDAAGLDPDEDAAAIAELLEAVETLEGGVEAAEAWTDLPVREQLRRDGFYDVLEHVKDFPPELSALKVHEREGNVEQILLALETFDSDFMEDHCLDALERLGPAAATDVMLERAGKRDDRAIAILGSIGDPSEAVVEAVTDYVDAGDENLRRVAIRTLGQVGASDALEAVAEQLTADSPDVRSSAARSLGLIGDPRAIPALETTLEGDDVDRVRASAAWALVQIGTVPALEAAAAHADDEAALVQAEAERARSAAG